MQISLSITPTVLEEQTKIENNVSVTVKPLVLTPDQPALFEITFNTHSVGLDFSVEDVVSLTDNQGNQPSGRPRWNGSPPGGHHRSGTLTFTKPLTAGGKITLVIKNVSDAPTREFTWNIL